MATALTKSLNKRKGRKVIIEKIIVDIDKVVIEEVTVDRVSNAKILSNSISEKYERIKELNDVIEDLYLDDEEKLVEELEGVYEFELKIKTTEEKLKQYLRLNNKTEVNTTSTDNNKIKNVNKVKLPKITIKPFDGNPLNWKTFTECFNATVNSNTDITDIEKFTYLKGYLEDSVLKVIEGLPLSNENYKQAWDLLESRYSNPQLIISSHMNNLLKLKKLSAPNVKELRLLYDNIDSNVRALNSVGIKSSDFGPLLIPIALDKLPNVIQLQVSRKLGNCKWDIESFLQNINEEIIARENFEFMKGTQEDEKRKNSTVAVNNSWREKKRVCVFCKSDEHFSDKCDVITNVEDRKNKLKEEKRCFACFGLSHSQRTCRRKLYCYSCKGNNHNTALCFTSMVVKNDNAVLLQTANAYIMSPDESNRVHTKVLCDPASQQSYISENMVHRLGLVPVRTVNVNIKAFGDKQGQQKALKEYQVAVRANEICLYLNGLAVPTICTKISCQVIKDAIVQHPFLKTLRLADDGTNPNLPIGLLVGSDYYWKLVNAEIKMMIMMIPVLWH